MVKTSVRRLRSCVVGTALALAGAGAAHASGPPEVVDDQGRRVQLNAPAQRIVSLAPHLTELLFEAGAAERIVGAAAYSDYPEAARRIPRVGDAHGVDLERIVRMRPDLVVAWASGTPRRTIERIHRLGIPLFESEPRRLEDIPRTLERLGVLAGSGDIAHARAQAFRDRRDALVAAHAGKRSLRVFYEVWNRPLMTVGPDHLIADALQHCGARSVFGERRTPVATPAREAVLLSDPDAIVVASPAPGAVAPWLRWQRLRAVRDRAVFTTDPQTMHRPTSRMLAPLASLCARLEPLRRR